MACSGLIDVLALYPRRLLPLHQQLLAFCLQLTQHKLAPVGCS
uniref:Uncharacterized protein n=1 Tax=Arundo donax TaxID=35708 RepID=A0A0A9BE24_ARUDO